MFTIDDRGQATTEYGLVIVGAGAIAMALIAWVAKSHALTDLFDHVFQSLTGKV